MNFSMLMLLFFIVEASNISYGVSISRKSRDGIGQNRLGNNVYMFNKNNGARQARSSKQALPRASELQQISTYLQNSGISVANLERFMELMKRSSM
jgi:hypothetical protein